MFRAPGTSVWGAPTKGKNFFWEKWSLQFFNRPILDRNSQVLPVQEQFKSWAEERGRGQQWSEPPRPYISGPRTIKNFWNRHFGPKIKNKSLITDVKPSRGGPDSPCPWSPPIKHFNKLWTDCPVHPRTGERPLLILIFKFRPKVPILKFFYGPWTKYLWSGRLGPFSPPSLLPPLIVNGPWSDYNQGSPVKNRSIIGVNGDSALLKLFQGV